MSWRLWCSTSCSAAELISVSVEQCKNQSSKLHLQTVKKVNHVHLDDDIHTIIPCKDSSFYAISIHPGCGINSFSVHYLDRKGEIIWSKESSMWVAHLYNFKGYTDDNNTLTIVFKTGSTTSNNGIARIDDEGNLLFYRCFNPNTYEFSNIIKGDVGFFLTGVQNQFNNSSSVSTLVHMNDDGTVNWVKSYGIANIPRLLFNDAMRIGDSLLIVGNYTEAGFPEKTFPCLLKTDLNGNIGSSFYYRIETIDVDRYKFTEVDSYDETSIYLKFRASAAVDGILKINNQLQSGWAKDFSGELGTICASYDGGVLFTGSLAFDGDIAHMNAQGVLQSSNATNSLPNLSMPSQIQRHDCGYLIALPMGWPDDRFAHISKELKYCESSPGENFSLYSINTVNRLALSIVAQDTPVANFSMYGLSGTFSALTPTETADCEAEYACQGALHTETYEEVSSEIYPNPAYNTLNFISYGEPITIVSTTGVVMYSGYLENDKLDIGAFAPGIYLLICGQRFEKFVKC